MNEVRRVCEDNKRCCGRCGRTDKERVMGYSDGIALCHAYLNGHKADPDCYHLVTIYDEPMTWLLRAFEGHE